MSAQEYSLDALLLVVLIVSTAFTARSLRRLLLPASWGAPARLAETVLGIAALTLIGEALGTLHELHRWPLVIAAACVAAAAAYADRRYGRYATPAPQPPRSGGAPVAVAAVAVTAVATRAVQGGADAWHSGMLSYDTLWYHLPFAARFAQEGSTTHLQYVGNGPTTFYPANGELFHGLGMVLFHSDLLSPWLNLAWLGAALLGGWCIGRPYGVAPATTVATCLVAFLPVFGGAQTGTAGTDVAVLALILAAVALLAMPERPPAAVALAAVAAGLAVGTKLDAWATVLALGVVVVVFARRRRARAALAWSAGLAVGGGYWYLRNLAAVGNPFPWFGGKIDGLVSVASTTAPTDCGRTTVAHYLTRGGFLSAHIVPQLAPSFGARWWLVLGLAAVGTGAAALSPRPYFKALAVVALVSAVAYLFTPATAGGHEARCFAFNTRFAAPPLALGLILLALASAGLRFGPLLSVVTLGIALVLTVHPVAHPAPLIAAATALAIVSLVASGRLRRAPRPALAGVALVAVVLTGLAGRHAQQAYAGTRYVAVTFSDPVAPIAGHLRRVHHARIAVLGLSESYPLYGADLSNVVDYPARRADARFVAYRTCRGWIAALARGRYDYVVTAREGTARPAAARWTQRYPRAILLRSSAPGATSRGAHWTWQLFRLDPTGHADPRAACKGAR